MPKFTIRHLFFAIVIFALIFAVFGWAVRGNIAAFGLGVAIFGLVIPFLSFAFLTFVARLLQGYTPQSDIPKYSMVSQTTDQPVPEKDK